jgi:signal transduction histidine kinase
MKILDHYAIADLRKAVPMQSVPLKPWDQLGLLTAGSWYKAFALESLLVILCVSVLIGCLFLKRKLKRMMQERMDLSGSLIKVQEHERSRLARELHDDFSQRLAVLALGLETAAEMIPRHPFEAERQLHELINDASEIGADLHTLSHRLHSSTLESLGLVPGVSAFCREFSAQQGMEVEFTHRGIPSSVPPELALCLFRVVQEGLRNAKKHSGASTAHIILESRGDMLHLLLSDGGVGVDCRKSLQNGGLGIRSMQERVRWLGGRFEIHSRPLRGTRIDVWVPLQPCRPRKWGMPMNENPVHFQLEKGA